MVKKVEKIWMDGELVSWDDANIHILSHSIHYGLAAFEGIRCYLCENGRSAIFRHVDHTKRLFDSTRIYLMEIPFSEEEIVGATKETLKVNGLREAYIRPIVFIGDGNMGVHPGDNPIRVSIICWEWGAYLGDEALAKGIRVKTSSFTRHHPNIMMTKAKVSGNYVNSILAKREVTLAGYDEALMLDHQGYVAEGSGENIFYVRDGVLTTPPLTSVLPGITRDTVIRLAGDMGYDVKETLFPRDALYTADEVFFTGTAAEITPIREIDDRVIADGLPGPITKQLQDAFFDVVRGKNKKYLHWLDFLDD